MTEVKRSMLRTMMRDYVPYFSERAIGSFCKDKLRTKEISVGTVRYPLPWV